MSIDRIPWGIWVFRLSLLLTGSFQTVREFQAPFSGRRGRKMAARAG